MTVFLSLFSGIGGFDLAAYRCGLRFDRHLFSEIDPYAIKVFQARFPDAEPLGDITKIKKEDLPDGDYIIAGGFPCQDISVAGKGAGLAGARSGLWFEMLRLIGDLRPRFVVVENVGALLVRGIDTVLGTLAEIGYDAEWQIISAASVGAPHRRERVYIVAYPTIDHSNSWRPESAGFIRKARSTDGGDDVADAPNGGNVRGNGKLEPTQGQVRLDRGSEKNGSREWWAIEPNVGRVAHGVPSTLDGGIDEILQILWQRDGTPQMVERTIRQHLAESTILFKQMLRRLDYLAESSKASEWAEKSAKSFEDGAMRDLWIKNWFTEASQRQESTQQYPGKLSYSLSSLPQERSLERRNMGNQWIQEPDIPRVAIGVPERVNRLKCLGNAIVPQCAEVIFNLPAFDEWRIAAPISDEVNL